MYNLKHQCYENMSCKQEDHIEMRKEINRNKMSTALQQHLAFGEGSSRALPADPNFTTNPIDSTQ